MIAFAVLLQLFAGTTNLLVVINELRHRRAIRWRTLLNLYVALLCFSFAAAEVAGYSIPLRFLIIGAAPIVLPAPFVIFHDGRQIRRLEREHKESRERFDRLMKSMKDAQ